MLNLLSKISVIDNSGGKLGMIIKRKKPKTIKAYASVGHIITISMKKAEGKIIGIQQQEEEGNGRE